MDKSGFYAKGWTLGELNALLKIITTPIAKAILQGKAIFHVKYLETMVLKGNMSLPAMSVPTNLFEILNSDNDNLCFQPGFKDSIVKAIDRNKKSYPAIAFSYFDLIKESDSGEIRNDLPADYVFNDAGAFCVMLLKLIDVQQRDSSNKVLNADRYRGHNVFYVRGIKSKIVEVLVFRCGVSLWSVDTSPSIMPKSIDTRVFSNAPQIRIIQN